MHILYAKQRQFESGDKLGRQMARFLSEASPAWQTAAMRKVNWGIYIKPTGKDRGYLTSHPTKEECDMFLNNFKVPTLESEHLHIVDAPVSIGGIVDVTVKLNR